MLVPRLETAARNYINMNVRIAIESTFTMSDRAEHRY
jgi:hypothetical protein